MVYKREPKSRSQSNTTASGFVQAKTIQTKSDSEVDSSELAMPGYTPLPTDWDASQHFLLKNRASVNNDVAQAKMSNDGGSMTTQPETAALSAEAPNQTGMPDQLKAGLEQMSGMNLSDVRVHRHSSKPKALQALAYTQGTNIYLGPGQERHLPHEGWHVVQQREGRVKPTLQMKSSVQINDDPSMEKEADMMGAKAFSFRKPVNSYKPLQKLSSLSDNVLQRKIVSYQEADKKLSPFLAELDKQVQTNAETALALSKLASDGGGYMARWISLAEQYLTDKKVPPFLYAAYGYAVETLTNDFLKGGVGSLPDGWKVITQVTHGMTRPDIVVENNHKKEVAWIDLTSQKSEGHITNKAGSGWKTKDYVYEITYPQLKPSAITQKGGMYEGIKARSRKRKRDSETEVMLVVLKKEVDTLSKEDVSTSAKTKKVFDGAFGVSLSHKTIKSLLEMGGKKLTDFGYGRGDTTGKDKPRAERLVWEWYDSTQAKKSKKK